MKNGKTGNLGIVAIIGPGLIGGSIGLGLKKNGLAASVTGVGRRRVSLKKAVESGAVDRTCTDIRKGVQDADIVILCTSVRLIPDMAAAAIPAMKPGAVLTDVGSTKRHIVEHIKAINRRDIAFIGGHPIAGSEQRGIGAARQDLFEGHVCILTPANRNARALQKIKSLWTGLGAKVQLLSPAEHDRILAHTSHLPLLLAAALVNTAGAGKLKYAGPGLRDMTRIASSDPALWCDILAQNRREVLAALTSFQKELSVIKSAISGKKSRQLSSKLTRAKRLRDAVPGN